MKPVGERCAVVKTEVFGLVFGLHHNRKNDDGRRLVFGCITGRGVACNGPEGLKNLSFLCKRGYYWGVNQAYSRYYG